MISRQQQRQHERAEVKRGEAAIAAGFAVQPPREDVLAVARVLLRTLREGGGEGGAARAGRLLHDLAEASARRTPGQAKLACAKGCGHCCHSWVGATAPEVFTLAEAIRARSVRDGGEFRQAVIARSGAVAGRTSAERFGARLPCPVLDNGACSVYRDRPTVCRQTTSFDLAACIEEFEGRGLGEEMPVSRVHLMHARNVRVPLLAALRVAGLAGDVLELGGALKVALEVADAQTRWLAGEDVFAGVLRGPAPTPEIAAAVADLARGLAGGGSLIVA